MKAKNILKAAAISTLILFGTTNAAAHSNHDHSTLTHKWEFSNDIKNKIARSMDRGMAPGSVGLTKFEQNKMNHYGIKIGNKFRSTMSGNTLTVERTSMGIRILDVDKMMKMGTERTLPIQKLNEYSRISGGVTHHGHDHSRIPAEWTFGQKTHDRIFYRLHDEHPVASVGLSHFEQKLFDEYGIKVGQVLKTRVLGLPFTFERTSSGVAVHKTLEGESVAEVINGSSQNDRF